LQSQSAQLAAERELLASTRKTWDQERESLTRALAEQREELVQLRDELSAARENATCQEPRQNGHAGAGKKKPAVVEAPNGRWLDQRPAPPAPANALASLPALESPALESPALEASGSLPAPMPASVGEISEQAVAPLLAGRRKSAKPEGLPSFVSERLSNLEHVRRRQALMLWATVTVTILVTAATAFGLWFWLL
jgi:hypothetical protein